jgi:hypothetical protein
VRKAIGLCAPFEREKREKEITGFILLIRYDFCFSLIIIIIFIFLFLCFALSFGGFGFSTALSVSLSLSHFCVFLGFKFNTFFVLFFFILSNISGN